MKLLELVRSLWAFYEKYGNIRVFLTEGGVEGKQVVTHEAFYVTDEQYEDGMAIVIRLWPY